MSLQYDHGTSVILSAPIDFSHLPWLGRQAQRLTPQALSRKDPDASVLVLGIPSAIMPAVVSKYVMPVALVASTHSVVPAAWLGVARTQKNCVFLVPDDQRLCPALERWVAFQLLGTDIQSFVTSVASTLSPNSTDAMQDIVRAVLFERDRISRPRDLARTLTLKQNALLKFCRRAGFDRTEHLITMIRQYAWNHLRNDEEVKSMRIDQMLGIRDRSNFRRQLRRALSGRTDIEVK